MKIVINTCFGGFGLSPKALLTMFEEGFRDLGTPVEEYFVPKDEGPLSLKQNLERWRKHLTQGGGRCGLFLKVFTPDEKFVLNVPYALERTDPRLVEIVERLGEEANGDCAHLKIVIVPDDEKWHISEYDGKERVSQNHKTWD